MRPVTLKIQAFGSYGKETTIDFTKPEQNIFLISGDTGSGKTTIFDAMMFALFGKVSSLTNKKNGNDLKSQVTTEYLKPFVELEFDEGDRRYKIYRSPNHQRPVKRGGKETSETESVALTDFSTERVYDNKNDVKAKLDDLIQLDKEQFMQVAMIAQGEFMDVLRASTNDRLKIFRKIFKTEKYNTIVEKLRERSEELKGKVKSLVDMCRMHANSIPVPVNFPRAEELRVIKEDNGAAQPTTLANIDKLRNGLLGELFAFLDSEKERKNAESKDAGEVKDRRNKEFGSAEPIAKAFESLKNAQLKRDELEARSGEMTEKEKLAKQLDAAFEIQKAWKLFEEVQSDVDALEKELRDKENLLPELEKAQVDAENHLKSATTEHETAQNEFGRVETSVNSALERFQKIDEARAVLKGKEKEKNSAENAETSSRKALDDLEKNVAEWRESEEKLHDAPARLVDLKGRKERFNDVETAIAEAVKSSRDLDKQRELAQKAEKEYELARQDYDMKNAEYEVASKRYLDAQAGYIAQTLQPGKPCPVCGSLEHPEPCQLTDGAESLTREKIDELKNLADKARGEQEHKAGASGEKKEGLKNRKDALDEKKAKVRELMTNVELDASEELDLDSARRLVAERKGALVREIDDLEKACATLKILQEKLKNSESEKQTLRESADRATKAANDARNEYSAAQSALKTLEEQKCDYESKDAANAELKKAKDKKNNAEQAYNDAKRRGESTSQDYAKAKEAKRMLTEDTLPKRRTDLKKRADEYDTILKEKGILEENWKRLVAEHLEREVDELQEEVKKYREEKSTCEGQLKNAKEQTEGKVEPDLDELKRLLEEAKEKYDSLNAEAREIERQFSEVKRIKDDIDKSYGDREAELRRSEKVETLYKRLGEKGLGIEAYVQRLYLENALKAANKRLYKMTNGEYELRLRDPKDRGNKKEGLELDVYSNITCKPRNVETLSGGESFKAAMALALGMSDQIANRKQTIHLDIMFIDEGFGSLDDESRKSAIDVLKELAGDKRLIGVISHVNELKHEIDDVLLVTKDREGSHVKWA